MPEHPVALVTGSSRGIGRAIAESFLVGGYTVVGCGRGADPKLGAAYDHVRTDIGDEQAVRELVAGIGLRHGRLDVVANSAGSMTTALVATTPPGAAQEVVQVNLLGTFYVCREAAKLMVPRRSGRIVNFASMAVPLQMPGTALYSASKAAVIQLTKVLAKELAGFGITCNVVAPSYVETELSAAIADDAVDAALARLTIRRPATFADIVNVVSFFTHPDSAYVTGQVIYLGLTA